jgi:hypothetical protein
MTIHYFHCTDGVDLIVDREGRDISGPRELAFSAKAAAEAVMQAVPSYEEWEAWAVYVYNERGQVAIVPFLPGLDDATSTGALPGDVSPGLPVPPSLMCEADAACAAPAL